VIIPVAAYVVLVLGGVTQSSIGIDSLRADPAHPTGTMIGEARAIRSDEWLTSMPVTLGVTATGSSEYFNPLAAPQQFLTSLPSGPVSSVVLFDGTALQLGPWLPDAMLVSARYWLPWLLLVLATPAFFQSLTGSRRVGYLATALIAFAPVTAWWSYTPVGILGFAIAGAVALQRCAAAAVESRRGAAVGWGLLSAVILARTPLGYQPWAIVLVTSVLLVAVVGIVVPSERRRRAMAAVAATGLATILLVLGILIENRDALAAVTDTVFPGRRVTTGGPQPFQEIFGATGLGPLNDTMPIAGTNASEISSAFAVCFVWAILLLAHGVTFRDAGHRAAVIALSAVSAFWFAWATVDFGGLGTHIPLANMVPASRAADILGLLGIVLLCLVLPAAAQRNGWLFSAMTAGACAAVVGYAGSLLRTQNLPEISINDVWISTLLVALVVLVVTRWPHGSPGYVLAGVCAFLLVWDVNPVLIGLGDLRGTPVASQMLGVGKTAREDGSVWVSDNAAVDSLLMATGVPSLSGRQIAGPDKDAWQQLDPNPADEALWNRGGAYVWFEWTDSPTVTLDNPGADIIHVVASPCTVAERMPDVTRIVASHRLSDDCLTKVSTFVWGGAPHFVYAVDR
jgi:hypothetical protein